MINKRRYEQTRQLIKNDLHWTLINAEADEIVDFDPTIWARIIQEHIVKPKRRTFREWVWHTKCVLRRQARAICYGGFIGNIAILFAGIFPSKAVQIGAWIGRYYHKTSRREYYLQGKPVMGDTRLCGKFLHS